MAKTSSKGMTPMLKQYFDIKEQYKDLFVFFRMGDFYELFFEDALKASRILGITLTSRGQLEGKDIPMCGVPHHSVNNYLMKMVEKNQKVAICEQVEDPKEAKGVVKREVVRVITPGTVIDDSLLKSSQSNYLVALSKMGAKIGLSYAEISTGEFYVSEFRDFKNVDKELGRINPKEIIVSKSLREFFEESEYFCTFGQVTQTLGDWIFDHKYAFQTLCEQFNTHSLDGFGLDDHIPGVSSAGAIIYYVKKNCSNALNHMTQLKKYQLDDFIALDTMTKKNLELTESASKDGLSLFDVLNKTHTPMGSRMLHQWILMPLRDVDQIYVRQHGVTELKEKSMTLRDIQSHLKQISDIERINGRVLCQNANPRDLLGLNRSLSYVPLLKKSLAPFESSIFQTIMNDFKDYQELKKLIEQGIHPEAPMNLKDGQIIQSGFSAELDELRDISKNAKVKISEIQKNEIEKTKIKNLKIKFNNVFGYYLEVSKGQVHLVPDYFVRKQTLVNAERYITEELKELESKILGAEQKILHLEHKLFKEIRENVAGFSGDIKKTAHQISVLDSLCSLAESSLDYAYNPPKLDESDHISIKSGRHPVVERLLDAQEFIANETYLDQHSHQISLITGPNMAGKSTYIRQVALIVLMAQIGSHVPASEVSLGVVDQIYTRVGASDDLSKGKSTFMVEMNETANILNNATEKSLIILDEIGRGTSTFDGISIAWAVIEYLFYHSKVKAKTLFATHYHELTVLEKKFKGVKNYNISVKEWNDQILFLRKIVPGPADKSYGIHVARLAGLPHDVIKRAKEVLMILENGGLRELTNQVDESGDEHKEHQMQLFKPWDAATCVEKIPASWSDFVDEIKEIDILNKTPIQAMTILSDLVEKSQKLS